MWFRYLLCFTGLGLLTSCASRREALVAASLPPEPYLRLVQSTNALEMRLASRELRPRSGRGPSVWLTGVSHVGDSNYFAAIQHQLDERNLVLFEGIGFDGSVQQSGASEAGSSKDSVPRDLQSRIASSFGLVFQLEALDYTRSHFKNSDLTVSELRDLLSGPGASKEGRQSLDNLLETMQGKDQGVADNVFGFVLTLIGESPKLRATAKLMLMELLAGVEGDVSRLSTMEPALKPLLETLIQKRNQKVVVDLRAELALLPPDQSVAVLYGAGHMIDLEERIRREFDYVTANELWLPAMAVDFGPTGVSPAERETVRKFIQTQLQPQN